MTRRRTDRDDGRKPTAARWVCVEARGKFKTWNLGGTAYYVKHCGHPTANYPWYGETPDGRMITSGPQGDTGYAFRYVDDAKVAIELIAERRYAELPMLAIQRGRVGRMKRKSTARAARSQ